MTASSWLLRVPVLLLGLGCSVQAVNDTPNADDTTRQPLGKADNVGSCEAPDGGDYCGGASYGNCYCDDACEAYGDCCTDKPTVCGGEDDDAGDDGVVDPDQCVLECNLTCGQAFGCDCEEQCGVEPEPEPEPNCFFICMASCDDDGSGACLQDCAEECPPAPQEFCVTDDQCGDGETCNTDICVGSCPFCLDCNHVCMPEIDPEPEPEPEPDPAQLCMIECMSTCGIVTGDCGCAELCGVDEPAPPTFCGSDDQCGDDQVCDTTLCVPSCPFCEDCNFVCVDA